MIEKKYSSSKKLVNIFSKEASSPAIWIMRQAGRYLPEYREIRSDVSNFLELCYTPELAAEVTLQPLKRFPMDAAIIFSDILVIPDALGMKVEFKKGEGPLLKAIKSESDIEKLNFDIVHLEPVYEALKIVSSKLDDGKSLIGFSGAPWTLATYMLEGGSSRDFVNVKTMAYAQPCIFGKMIDILVDSVSKHLIKQIESGADVLQIFDSWAGALTESEYEKWVLEPTKKIVYNVKAQYPDTPIIGFPRGSGVMYKKYSEYTGVDGVSIDQHTPIKWASDNIDVVIQGNLDPVLLATNKDEMLKQAAEIIKICKDRPFIFNLGHGVLPFTPVENVNALVELVVSA